MYDGQEVPGANFQTNGYYTDLKAKYIRYEVVNMKPVDSLKSALAFAAILNRTLILPKFPCGNSMCPLNCFIRLSVFDTVFKYREYSFSTHALVPEAVKTSVSPMYFATKNFPVDVRKENMVVIQPKDPVKGMNDQEIIEHFGGIQHSILQFHTLDGAFSHFTNDEEQSNWEAKVKRGITEGKYRQYM